MPIPAEFLALPSEHPDEPVGAPLLGRKWACGLGGLLLALLFLTVAARWLGSDPTKVEAIVQQPVLPSTPVAAPRPELTAPDPGDNLP